MVECSDASGGASRAVLAQDALSLANAETQGAEGSTTGNHRGDEAYSRHPSKVLRPAQMPASASPVNKPR